MATLTKDQQRNYARVYWGLSEMFGKESAPSEVWNALNIWMNDEDKNLLANFLDKFGIPTREHRLFLNFCEQKIQAEVTSVLRTTYAE